MNTSLDGLVQDCSNSIADTLEFPRSSTISQWYLNGLVKDCSIPIANTLS